MTMPNFDKCKAFENNDTKVFGFVNLNYICSRKKERKIGKRKN